jgi:hypothetical protein
MSRKFSDTSIDVGGALQTTDRFGLSRGGASKTSALSRILDFVFGNSSAYSPTFDSPLVTSLRLANQGTGAFNFTVTVNTTMTAGRALTLALGDAARTLTMTGDATVNQDVSTAGSPSFPVVTTTTAFRAADGSAGAPSLSFASTTNLGWFRSSSTGMDGSAGGFARTRVSTAGLVSAESISISSASGTLGAPTVTLNYDADDTLAQRRGTNTQTLRLYDRYTNSTNYSRMSFKSFTTTLASVSGASVTATNLIPAATNVIGVNSKVTVALGTGGGTTGYQVGDGTDADRWGSITGTDTATASGMANATADPRGWFQAANNVVVTANGGNFNGTGSIYLAVAAIQTEAD